MVKRRELSRNARDNIDYYLLMAVPFVLIFIFSYLPLFGVVIAFQNYTPGKPFIGASTVWVGMKHFITFIKSYYFTRILRNTVVLNFMGLLMGFWVPVVFALVVNEIPKRRYKNFIQTVSYMPNFISTVVVAGMVLTFIANDGIITRLINAFGFNVKSLNATASVFPWVYTLTNIWKSFGWSSILYLSTITSIDPELYESADIDGASRLGKIAHITFPMMLPLVMIQLIFAVGNMLGSNTEMVLLLYNSAVYSTADVIGTYVYRDSLLGVKYSYGTASGLLLSVMSFVLVFGANAISRKTTNFSLW
ncbi:MAG: ABC transporter permease subunit [Oscillospiraceae bacterium]|jgi:putative aldouronate transport system permease protein|nr:ABC transporter permease subunit [Oscillospiraceae bacterium]